MLITWGAKVDQLTIFIFNCYSTLSYKIWKFLGMLRLLPEHRNNTDRSSSIIIQRLLPLCLWRWVLHNDWHTQFSFFFFPFSLFVFTGSATTCSSTFLHPPKTHLFKLSAYRTLTAYICLIRQPSSWSLESLHVDLIWTELKLTERLNRCRSSTRPPYF